MPQDDRPVAPETTALTRQISPSTVPSVRRGADSRRAPLAPASVFGPVGRRKSWWYTYRCSVCSAYLFGRARSLDAVTGQRRAGCGHRVQIVAARIYSQPEPGVAA
jgi:hypothetical protein